MKVIAKIEISIVTNFFFWRISAANTTKNGVAQLLKKLIFSLPVHGTEKMRKVKHTRLADYLEQYCKLFYRFAA